MPVANKQSPVAKPRPRGGGVLDRIKPIGFTKDDPIKMLLYGKSGSGKTSIWATWPKPILAVLCSSLKEPGELRSIDRKDWSSIEQVTVQSTGEVREIVDYAKQGHYRTVVLDHASGFQDLTLKEILGLEELPAQKGWGLASQQQYGQSSLMCKESFRALLDLPTNVVIVAQERAFNAEGESELLAPYVGGAMTPSVFGWLAPACDYVCQTFIRPKMVTKQVKVGDKVVAMSERARGPKGEQLVEYCLRTAPHDMYAGKFRVPKGTPLPDVLIDADYTKIAKLIQGG
jgi:hypothetical protein